MNETSVHNEVFVSDSDIVPEDYQNLLMYWRDTFRVGYFSLGDVANRLCAMAAKQAFRVTEARVFEAVGKFCGKSGRTVRYYAETAEFFSDEMRQEYEMLPFSHFVFARSMGDRWREVLDYARAKPNLSEEGLRMAFVRGYALCFAVSEVFEPQAVETQYDQKGQLDTNCIDTPSIQPTATGKYQLLSSVSRIKESVNYLWQKLPMENMQEKARKEAEASLRAVEETIPTILRIIDGL